MNKVPRLISAAIIWLSICAIPATSFSILQVQPLAPSVEFCESKIAELESDLTLDETVKATSIGMYKKAVEKLAKANSFTSQTVQYQKLTNEAPQLLISIRNELGLPPVEPTAIIPEGATLPQLEQLLAQANATLQAERQSLADLQTESARRNEQSTSITARLAKARQELLDLVNPSDTSSSSEISQVLIDAQLAAYRTKAFVLQAEIESIEAELASYDARREL